MATPRMSEHGENFFGGEMTLKPIRVPRYSLHGDYPIKTIPKANIDMNETYSPSPSSHSRCGPQNDWFGQHVHINKMLTTIKEQ